ncbi:HNH endonuclease signature motif containing protein [uncultured Pseudokineococcus sp.]|uniref:HNH endonuclease signature motif containing protein n=1 Tax=uncultured Pseudokineococcus sp. TaxID=1642928 RepID=UPI0026301530|nr:HNH endonuclease signature motif containing protein [uncultured Pseudokineococcus sp.]
MGRPGGPPGALAPGSPGGGAPEGVDPVGDPREAAAAELAGALRMTLSAASRVVEQAVALTEALPTTLSALEAGRLDQARARVVVDGTAALAPADARVVDAQLAPSLGPLTTAQLAARIRYLVARLVPDAARRRSRRATCERGVRLFPLEDGMAQLTATGPALDLVAVAERLTAAAQQRLGPHGRTDPHAATSAGLAGPDLLAGAGSAVDGGALPDRRRMDARRFDALVDLVLAPAAPGRSSCPPAHRDAAADADPGVLEGGAALAGAEAPAGVHRGARGGAGACHGPQVVVALTTLAGLDDEPAQLAGHGAVPVEQVRELLAAGHPYRRALVDPWTGQLLGLDGHLSHPAVPPADPPRTPRPRRGEPGQDEAPPLPSELPRGSAAPRRATAPVGDPAPPPEPAEPSAGVRPVPSAFAAAPAARPATSGCPVAARGGGPYAPSLPLARFVRLRVQRCTFPGCRTPATRCDLDHRIPYADGGPTCECNLEPKCRRHHLAKHRYGWSDERLVDDPRDTGTRWTSPLGQVLESPGEPLLPLPPEGGVRRGAVDARGADPQGGSATGAEATDVGAPDAGASDAEATNAGATDVGAPGDAPGASHDRRGAALGAAALGGYRLVRTTRTGAGGCAGAPVARVRPCRGTDVADLGGSVELSRSLAVGHPYRADTATEDARRTRAEHARQVAQREAEEAGAVRRAAEAAGRARTRARREDDPPPF